MEYYIQDNEETTPTKTYVDLTYLDFENQDLRRVFAWVFIKMNQSDAQGWCYDDECLTLFSVSDSLNATLQKPCQAEPVGIKIHEGWFELYYYLESAKGFENSVKTILREAGYVSFEVGSAKDTKWSHYYQDLLPNARQQIQMQNRETIEALQVEDDDLSIVRDVEHYCFFQTQTQMLRFSDRMQSLGFLFKESVQEEHSEYPYGVVLIKEHDVEFDTVEAMSDTLFKALKEDHGTYLGWSTVLGANR